MGILVKVTDEKKNERKKEERETKERARDGPDDFRERPKSVFHKWPCFLRTLLDRQRRRCPVACDAPLWPLDSASPLDEFVQDANVSTVGHVLCKCWRELALVTKGRVQSGPCYVRLTLVLLEVHIT